MAATPNNDLELTKEESTLQNLFTSYAEKVEKTATETVKQHRSVSADDEALRKVKPFFKYWLDLRARYHAALGTFRRLTTHDHTHLSHEAAYLVSNFTAEIPNIKAGKPTETVEGFIDWLKEQISATVTAIDQRKPKVSTESPSK